MTSREDVTRAPIVACYLYPCSVGPYDIPGRDPPLSAIPFLPVVSFFLDKLFGLGCDLRRRL